MEGVLLEPCVIGAIYQGHMGKDFGSQPEDFVPNGYSWKSMKRGWESYMHFIKFTLTTGWRTHCGVREIRKMKQAVGVDSFIYLSCPVPNIPFPSFYRYSHSVNIPEIQYMSFLSRIWKRREIFLLFTPCQSEFNP